MDRQTSKTLRKLADAAGVTSKSVKRDWLKMSHKQRGVARKALGIAKAGGGK